MQTAIWAAAFLILGYLSGSVNYAIIVTHIVLRKDIRTLGNQNPGTSNVVRSVGKPAGILVGLLDALKGVIPALIALLTVFPADSSLNFFILYCIGTAAVVGHCRPIWYGFKGGGGIGTMQGVSLLFIPVEYLFSMMVGGIIVLSGVKSNVKFRISRLVPILFTTLTPFVTLATSRIVDIRLFAHIRIGGHTWGLVAGTFVMSLSILGLSANVLKESTDQLRDITEETVEGNLKHPENPDKSSG